MASTDLRNLPERVQRACRFLKDSKTGNFRSRHVTFGDPAHERGAIFLISIYNDIAEGFNQGNGGEIIR